MDPHFLHIRGSYDDAAPALAEWMGKPLDPTELAIEVEGNGWTTLSIDLDYGRTDEWLKLAKKVDFFYESYSTSLCMGELVVCREQQLVRHLLFDEENSDENINVGRLPDGYPEP